MTKDEAIREAAKTTQPEVYLAVEGYMVVTTKHLGELEMDRGTAIQHRAKCLKKKA